MAMLRNLRNMIQAGIGAKYHAWVIKKLTDEGAVTHSKQFPFRFFSAYEVLTQMEEKLDKAGTIWGRNISGNILFRGLCGIDANYKYDLCMHVYAEHH